MASDGCWIVGTLGPLCALRVRIRAARASPRSARPSPARPGPDIELGTAHGLVQMAGFPQRPNLNLRRGRAASGRLGWRAGSHGCFARHIAQQGEHRSPRSANPRAERQRTQRSNSYCSAGGLAASPGLQRRRKTDHQQCSSAGEAGHAAVPAGLGRARDRRGQGASSVAAGVAGASSSAGGCRACCSTSSAVSTNTTSNSSRSSGGTSSGNHARSGGAAAAS